MSIEITKNSDSQGGYFLKAESIVSRDIDQVFAFFADARNLQELTPSWLKFEIATSGPLEMQVGQLIDYRLKVRGFPLRWQSEITAWEPTTRFVDQARRGPYRFWHHEHRFESCAEGTKVIDKVRYDVPGGALVHALLVRRDLLKIFSYRQQVLARIFTDEPS